MKSLLLFSAILLTAYASFSQPGSLDKSFGEDGFSATTEFGYHNAVVQQPDGKLVTASSSSKGGVIRFLPDGTLDSAFGTNGFFSSLSGKDLVLLPDNKILAFGSTRDEANVSRIAVVRLLPDGRADSSFGLNGFAFTPIYKDYYTYNHLAVKSDGTIIIAGFGQTNPQAIVPEYSFISRISPEGVFDANLGAEGRILNYTIIGERALALQEDGKILLGGYNSIPGLEYDNFTISRYNGDGTIDANFGNNGTVSTDGLGSIDDLTDIIVQPDGKILAGGYSGDEVGGLYKMSAFRYTPNGSLDATFGNEGKTFVSFENMTAQSSGILLQPDGKIILAGTSGTRTAPSESSFALCRLNNNGTVDSSFAIDGRNVTPYLNYNSSALCAALQKDGRIVLGGEYYNSRKGYDNYLLARYNGDGDKKSLIAKIKRWLNNHGIGWKGLDNTVINYYSVQYSKNGSRFTESKRVSGLSSSAYQDYNCAVESAGYYRVVAVDKNGYKTISNSIYLNEGDLAGTFKIYPNPVRSTLQLQGLSTNNKTNITVTDFAGNVRTSTTSSGSTASINASALKPGNYLLKVQSGNTITTHPFIKQ